MRKDQGTQLKDRYAANVVFLHGGLQGGWVWSPTVAALLAQDTRSSFLILDVPGCGAKRGRNTQDTLFHEIGEELIAEVGAAGISDAVLVGHSQAGTLVPRMAELAPRLFRKLVYLSCVAPQPGQTTLVGTTGSRMRAAPPGEAAFTVERLRSVFCNDMSPDEADRFMAALGRDVWPQSAYTETQWRYDHLAGFPSTYVLCLKDEAVPAERQLQFAEQLRADEIVRIDAGHQAMVTRPHTLAEVLLLESANRGS